MRFYITTIRDKEAERLAVHSLIESGEIQIWNIAKLKKRKIKPMKGVKVNSGQEFEKKPHFRARAFFSKWIKDMLKSRFN